MLLEIDADLDHVEEHLVDTGALAVDERGVEQHLRRLKALHADLDLAVIGQHEGLEHGRGLESKALLDLEVVANVAALLLDLADSLEVGSAVEVVAAGLRVRRKAQKQNKSEYKGTR